MPIIRDSHKSNYTCISNSVLQNSELSFAARGILCYLLSKPDNWKVIMENLKNETPKEKTIAIRNAVKELIDAGHIVRIPNRVNGVIAAWDTEIFESPANNLEVNKCTSRDQGKSKAKKSKKQSSQPAPDKDSHQKVISYQVDNLTDGESNSLINHQLENRPLTNKDQSKNTESIFNQSKGEGSVARDSNHAEVTSDNFTRTTPMRGEDDDDEGSLMAHPLIDLDADEIIRVLRIAENSPAWRLTKKHPDLAVEVYSRMVKEVQMGSMINNRTKYYCKAIVNAMAELNSETITSKPQLTPQSENQANEEQSEVVEYISETVEDIERRILCFPNQSQQRAYESAFNNNAFVLLEESQIEKFIDALFTLNSVTCFLKKEEGYFVLFKDSNFYPYLRDIFREGCFYASRGWEEQYAKATT